MAASRARASRSRRGPGPTQRRRSAATREKVIQAAIACIAEEGFRQATAQRIAERSGVSWGGIQHHFGDKAAILDAVLGRLLEDFRARLAGVSSRAASLEGRVRALVDAAWDLMRDPTYRAFREILGERGTEGIAPEQILGQVGAALDETGGALFADLAPDKETLGLVHSVLFATLSGMAEQERYRGYPPGLTRRQLAVLRSTLLRLLS